MAKGTTIFGIIFGLILVGGAFFMGWFYASDFQFGNDPQQLTPVIDGIIGKKEWMRSSYYNVPFYIDADNEIDPVVNRSNVDGWNYLSVAEDADFYYVAVDLCSDRTDNKDGEWFAFHLANRLPDAQNSKLAFYALEDFGYEYLFYNVSEDAVFDNELFYGPGPVNYHNIPIDPLTDTIEVLRGNTSGDMYDFWTDYDNKNFTGTSQYYINNTYWSKGDFLDIQFGVNVLEKFPDVNITAFTSSLVDMDLYYKLKSSLASDPSDQYWDAEEIYCSIIEHGGTAEVMDSWTFVVEDNPIAFPADVLSVGNVDLNHSNYNPSTGMFYFSLYCWNEYNSTHSTDYEIEIDQLYLKVRTDSLFSVVGSSIAASNYDIAYSYGPSDNCDEDHRMFEFKVAKAEFPTLEDDFLYLNIAGFGTLAMVGSDYWMYPMYGYPLAPIYSSITDNRQFQTFDMSIT